MTTENNETSNTNQEPVLNQDSANQEPSKDGATDNKDQSVPLKTFLEKKSELKELREKLNEFEERDRKIAEDKLIEEKNFQELIQKNKKELEEAKGLLDSERRNYKLEKIRNRFSNEFNKVNAIDADDALKFVKYDDLLEVEDIDSELQKRVKQLVENKSYLFKQVVRSESENGQPSGNSGKPANGNFGKVDQTLSSLAQKFSKI